MNEFSLEDEVEQYIISNVDDLVERVGNGIAWIERVTGDRRWADAIIEGHERETFHLEEPCGCVIGLTLGDYYTYFETAIHRPTSTDPRDTRNSKEMAMALGFLSYDAHLDGLALEQVWLERAKEVT